MRSKWNAEPDREDNYGHTNGQLGQETRDTFWASAKQIVQECHAILRPGGHAIWILKDFVRAGKRVEFCRDWQRLCESCGFTLLHVHQAMLVENYGTQRTTDNGDQEQTVARKSFFRRLAEAKGSPKIDFEEVQCFLRP